MKIGIVGLGYWGKIILKNLKDLGYNNIVVCEQQNVDWQNLGTKYKLVKSYEELDCDVVFVITPATSHYEVCRHFLEKGVDVFCEKPLTLTEGTAQDLYDLARKNNALLFVDWIFTFNPAVETLKKIIIKRGRPKNIIANRLNFGPPRYDVDAKWDLASHDVSIACYLLGGFPREIKWLSFKRNQRSSQNDSVVGVLSYKDTNMQINASWEYGRKDRQYSFEFDDGFVFWNDDKKKIIDDFEELDIVGPSPLHKSIRTFLDKSFCQEKQKNLTLDITRITNYENFI